MLTTTWELHFAAPRSPAQEKKALDDLGALKAQFTTLRIDWFDDGEKLSVMVGDVEVFLQALDRLREHTLLEVTCQFTEATYDGTAHGRLVLDDEEDERSEISFPTKDGSE